MNSFTSYPNHLVIPRLWFQNWLGASSGTSAASALYRLGDATTKKCRLLLPQNFDTESSIPDVGLRKGKFLEIILSEQPPVGWPSEYWLPDITSRLWLRTGRGRGFASGVLRTSAGIEPLHVLKLPGAGMHRLNLLPQTQDHVFSSTEMERHSRTIGALGGPDIWQRLIGLHVCLVGCGRSGSLIATDLARLGVHQLTLCDPDLLEVHNLGEMESVYQKGCGSPKVDALASGLRHIAARSNKICALPVHVSNQAALDACREADVIFACADNDVARLGAAMMATLHHKVLLDVATGINFQEQSNPMDFKTITAPPSNPPRRSMGADVRLIVPGDGCLLCRGNLTQYSHAIEGMITGRNHTTRGDEWQRERAGSLRSLNQVAVGIAIQMLQDLVAGRIQTSLWARVECDDSGRFNITYPTLSLLSNSCPLCIKAGLGDRDVIS
jgi:hypothetical protein